MKAEFTYNKSVDIQCQILYKKNKKTKTKNQ